MPSDGSLTGVFDGIDITAVLLHESEKGHETLFHPNSGMKGAVMVSSATASCG
jgi:hypothetical protein